MALPLSDWASRRAVRIHGVVSLVPRFAAFGFGYVGVYLPIVTGDDLLATVVMSAGLDVPFGRAPDATAAPAPAPTLDVATSSTARNAR